MRIRVVNPMSLSVNIVLWYMGRCSMCLYVLMGYLAATEMVSSAYISFSMYTFVAFGLVNFVVNKKMIIDSWYLVWYGIVILGMIMSLVVLTICWPGSEWTGPFYQMVIIWLLGLSFSQFLEQKKDFKLLFYCYVIGAVLLFAVLSATGKLYVDERLGTTVMGNANTFAMSYMVALIYCLWLILNSTNMIERVVLWIGAGVIFYSMLLSGGRKYILVPLLMLYIMLLLKRDKKGRRHIISSTIVVVTLVAVIFWLIMENETLYDVVGYRMEYLFNLATGAGQVGTSIEVRQELIKLGLRRGFESPIFGHGMDSFKNLGLRELQFYAYSHNNWIEMWYNHGAVGLFVYYWLYVVLFAKFWRRRNVSSRYTHFSIACLLSIVVLEYGVVSYYEVPIQIMLCIISAMYRAQIREERS